VSSEGRSCELDSSDSFRVCTGDDAVGESEVAPRRSFVGRNWCGLRETGAGGPLVATDDMTKGLVGERRGGRTPRTLLFWGRESGDGA
jgi:hypothetical protein